MIASRYNYILVILLPLMLILMYYRAYQLINITYIFIGLILLISNRSIILYLYIFLLPTNFFLPQVTNIFGFLSGREIVALFALIAGILEIQLSRKDDDFYDNDFLAGPRRYAWLIVILLILYITLTRIRDVFTGFNPGDSAISIFNLVSYTVKIIIFYFPLYYIIRLAKDDFYRTIFTYAFFYSTLLLSIGVIFSSFLFDSGRIEVISEAAHYGAVLRNAGFFGAGGDINSLAGFLAIVTGFFISQIPNLKMNRIVIYGGLAVMILAIIYSASRTGIICLGVVFFMNLKLRNFIFMLMGMLVLLYLIPNEIMSVNYDRFLNISQELDISGTGSRMFILSRYFTHITSQPDVFFFGASERFQTGAFQFVPHNFYITLLYRWGIIPVALLLFMIFRMGVYIFRIENKSIRIMLASAFIPMFLVSNTVSDFGYFYAFFMAFALIPTEEELDQEFTETSEEPAYEAS